MLPGAILAALCYKNADASSKQTTERCIFFKSHCNSTWLMLAWLLISYFRYVTEGPSLTGASNWHVYIFLS